MDTNIVCTDGYNSFFTQRIDAIIKIKYLPNYNLKEWGELKQAHSFDAGFDLRAAISEPLKLQRPVKNSSYVNTVEMNQLMVPTGICVEIPPGFEMQIRPRSGLAAKNNITIVNSPGTIDANFRGTIHVILLNLSSEDFIINPGDRIAQAVINKLPFVKFEKVDELSSTERGTGGFGSTGVK
jgi:dUTP pyrophosphatase